MSQVNMIDISGTTRPTDFVSADVSQNLTDTTDSSFKLHINKGQPLLSLNINKFTIDYSGNNGSNATNQTTVINASNTAPTGILTDIVVSDVSANTRYDLSVNQINSNDISNNKLGLYVVTRPSNFVSADISQNVSDSSANTLILKIHNSQIAGSLDISGYEIDISGDNQFSSAKKTVIKTATTKTADATNNDVSLNDLSANTYFDLSVNLIGSQFDLSNSKIVASGATAPTPFASGDVSQVPDFSDNRVILSAQHKDLVGTLDMSAVTIFYKGNLGTGTGTTNVTPDSINLINLDGTDHVRERNDINDAIDGGNGSDTYVTTSGTNSTHGPFVLEFGFPASLVGKNLHKIKARWGSNETGTLSLGFWL